MRGLQAVGSIHVEYIFEISYFRLMLNSFDLEPSLNELSTL